MPPLRVQPAALTGTDGDWRASIPTSRSLGADLLVHPPSERHFSPPALTNQWAMAQASRDITAYDTYSVPPAATGEGRHAELFFGLSGDDLLSCEWLDLPITYRWYPHAVERQVSYRGMEMRSVLALSTTADALVMTVMATNRSADRIDNLHLFLKTLVGLHSLVSRVAYERASHAFLCRSVTDQAAYAIQSVDREPTGYGAHTTWEGWYHAAYSQRFSPGALDTPSSPGTVATYGGYHFHLTLEPGASWTVSFVHALGDDEEAVRRAHDAARSRADAVAREAERAWDEEIAAAFTPGNPRFSGHLPVLATSDTNLKRLYDMSCLAYLLLKRTRRMGQPALVYATGMPGWDVCFLWDTQQASFGLALLDPLVLRRMIRFWIRKDPGAYFATNYVSGQAIGEPYAINDYALTFMVRNYLRVTGDHDWLREVIDGTPVLDHVVSYATRFLQRVDEDGLVDCGGPPNLLECVFSYAHKVPAMNAINVWTLRQAAALLQCAGRDGEAAALLQRADRVARAILGLYVPRQGYWNCKYPDGRLVPVRTCLDFNLLFEAMEQDLPAGVKEEMVHFFTTDLMTETWMHALSPDDPDAASSVRTDHQDNGAFAAWPAYGLLGLLRTGRRADALRWIGVGGRRGLATVTRQGPWGQAYFHGGAGSPLEEDAAMKAPKEFPYLERYAVITGAMYASVVIEELFGLRVDWGGVVNPTVGEIAGEAARVEGRPGLDARLYNVAVHGQEYMIEGVL